MAVLREPPWYQQILREGEQRGEERGRQEGRQEGRREGRREGILSGIELALEIKFGAEGLQLMPEISQIYDLEQLEVIKRRFKTLNTLDELHGLISSIQASST
jgi:predicted transposase YdaD